MGTMYSPTFRAASTSSNTKYSFRQKSESIHRGVSNTIKISELRTASSSLCAHLSPVRKPSSSRQIINRAFVSLALTRFSNATVNASTSCGSVSASWCAYEKKAVNVLRVCIGISVASIRLSNSSKSLTVIVRHRDVRAAQKLILKRSHGNRKDEVCKAVAGGIQKTARVGLLSPRTL